MLHVCACGTKLVVPVKATICWNMGAYIRVKMSSRTCPRKPTQCNDTKSGARKNTPVYARDSKVWMEAARWFLKRVSDADGDMHGYGLDAKKRPTK